MPTRHVPAHCPPPSGGSVPHSGSVDDVLDVLLVDVVEVSVVELEVDVSTDLDVTLTGWAEPVYRGELAEELVRSLQGDV